MFNNSYGYLVLQNGEIKSFKILDICI